MYIYIYVDWHIWTMAAVLTLKLRLKYPIAQSAGAVEYDYFSAEK